jgi:hypothetical protein
MRTHGRKRRPLSDTLADRLRAAGFAELADDSVLLDVHVWGWHGIGRNRIRVELTASDVPGALEVVARVQVNGQPAGSGRFDPDKLVAKLVATTKALEMR